MGDAYVITVIGVAEEKVPISYRDGKYPYLDTKEIDITNIGSRTRGRIVYVSGRFVKSDDDKSYIEFQRIDNIALKLLNAKIINTEKGTLILKYEPNSILYLIEIPSGFRGGIETQYLHGQCLESLVLRSPSGSLGYIVHIWCNGNAEIQYKISGRTTTAGYGKLTKLFGENLSGKVKIQNGEVKVIFDEQLDQLLS